MTPASRGRWRWVACGLAALLVWHAWFSQLIHDEIEHLHAAWLVAAGQRPFADFLEQHHPTLWYLLAPVTGWFRSPRALVFVVRLFDLGCLAAVLAALVGLLRRLYPQVSARWPVLLLATSFLFVRPTMEVRPDPLMNAFVYAGLLSWVAFLQEGRLRRAAAAGLLFGAAIAVLQKALVVLGLVAGATLLLALLHASSRERRGALLGGGAAMLGAAALAPAALVAFVAARGYAADFWFWNYEFNRFFYLQAHLSKHFSVLRTLGLNVAVNPVLWIAGTAGMVLCARELWPRPRSSERDDPRLGLLLVAAGYFVLLCRNRFPLEQYYIVLLPLLALFSAEAFARAQGARELWLRRGTAAMAAVLAAIVAFHPGSAPQRRVQEAVLARTAPGEPIFVPPPHHPIFRPDAAYFWYNGRLVGGAYLAYCRLHPECPGRKQELDARRWAAAPPAFVFLDDPEYQPLGWDERSRGYAETELPGLLARVDRAAGRLPPPPGQARLTP